MGKRKTKTTQPEHSGLVHGSAERPPDRKHLLWLILILTVAGAARLPHWTSPPIDYHAFRQCETLMIARNFHLHDPNLFRPMVDWLPVDRPLALRPVGGTELCVTPYLTSLLYIVFGVRDWVGRVAPLAFALVGAYYFWRLARRFCSEEGALLATLFLTLSPLFLVTGRLQMPEAFAYSMAFAALYHYDRWLGEGRDRDFWAGAALGALMPLGKLPLLVLGVPMAFLARARFGRSTLRTPKLYAYAGFVVVPVAVYTYYSALLAQTSGLTFSIPQLGVHVYLLSPEYWAKTAQRLMLYGVGPLLTVVAAVALARRPRARRDSFVYAWLVSGLATLILVPGAVFSNPHYLMIFAPPAALAAGEWLARVGASGRAARAGAGIAAVAVVGASLAAGYWLFRPVLLPTERCAAWLRENSPGDAPVLTNRDDPAVLYLADRRGWICWYQTDGAPIVFSQELIDFARGNGARVVAALGPQQETRPQSLDPFADMQPGVRDLLCSSFAFHHGNGFATFRLDQPADLSVPVDAPVDMRLPQNRKHLRGVWDVSYSPDGERLAARSVPDQRSGFGMRVPEGVTRMLLTLVPSVADAKVALSFNGQAAQPGRLVNAEQPRTFSFEVPEAVRGHYASVLLESTGPDGKPAAVEVSELRLPGGPFAGSELNPRALGRIQF